MPNIYEVELEDGRILDIESDTEPTEDDIYSALSSWQPPAEPDVPTSFAPPETAPVAEFGSPAFASQAQALANDPFRAPSVADLGQEPNLEPPQADAGSQALGRFAQGFGSGVAGLPEATAIAANALTRKFGDPLLSAEEEAADVTTRPLYKAGRNIRDSFAKDFPVDETRPRTFLGDTLPQAAGNMASFVLGGAAGKALRFAAPATVAAAGAATGGAEAFDEARKAGANDEDAFKVFAINAGLGATEAVPIAGWLNRLNKASGNKLKRAIIEGSAEAVQEVVQQYGGNLTAQKYYDKDRPWQEGLIEGGGAGLTLGSLMSLIVSAIGGRRGRAGQATAEPPQPPIIPPE